MAGRVISRANESKLRGAAQAIAEVLAQLGEEEDSARDAILGAETRVYDVEGLEVRADGDKPIISGYAAVFNRLSVMIYDFREQIAQGAFQDTLDRDIRALWNHDSGMVLGRNRAGTLRLWEDDTGLGFELKPPNTQAGRDAVELVSRGDVSQMSFGFNVPPGGDEWEKNDDGLLIRTLRRVELHEVSLVAFPAYPDTSAVLRSAPEWVQRALAQGVDDISEKDIRGAGALELFRMMLNVEQERNR